MRLRVDCNFESDGRRGNSLQKRVKVLNDEVARLQSILRSHGVPFEEEDQAAIDSEETHSEPRKDSIATPSLGLFQDPDSGQLVHYGPSSFHSLLAESSQRRAVAQGSFDPTDAYVLPTLPLDMHQHLLDLFFTYLNGYTVHLDQESFLRDCFSDAPTPDYSHLLHLSVLATAAHLSRKLGMRSHPHNPGTAGIGFTQEALRVLQQEWYNPKPSTAEALCLLCTTLGDQGEDSMSWIINGASVSIVQHLGLHVDNTPLPDGSLSRQCAFWGVFRSDK